jgi:uncharacterized RDD family membrane protein YckC
MIERHAIETPENVAFDYQVAGIGSRFLAALVDSLILGAVYVFLLIVALLLLAFSPRLNLPLEIVRQLSNILTAALLIAAFLILFGYYIVCEIVTGGQSPGKELVGLRVIKENGYPLSPLDSIIRNLVRVIDFFPFAYGFGIITMFFNARSKRLGDFAAGTLVVRVGQQVKLSELTTSKAVVDTAPEWPGIEQLTEAEIELIESFLQRRSKLDKPEALGAQIARRIQSRIHTSQVDEYAAAHSAQFFLEQVVAAYRARQARR